MIAKLDYNKLRPHHTMIKIAEMIGLDDPEHVTPDMLSFDAIRHEHDIEGAWYYCDDDEYIKSLIAPLVLLGEITKDGSHFADGEYVEDTLMSLTYDMPDWTQDEFELDETVLFFMWQGEDGATSRREENGVWQVHPYKYELFRRKLGYE